MNDELIIFGSACLSVVINMAGIPLLIKNMIWKQQPHLHRLKPLDCEFCLAFWLGIIGGIYFRTKPAFTIYIGAISSILAVFITKLLKK